MSAVNPAGAGEPTLTAAQQRLVDVWEAHLRGEFVTRSVEATMETMGDRPSVCHVPVLTGGVGEEQIRAFYATDFIPQIPPDWALTPVSRTVGTDRLVDELVVRFTHTVEMDWMLPGVPPTGRTVECATVVIVEFRDGQLVRERIYWDQASVLVQLGLLDAQTLPVAGVESARKVLDPSLPSNMLIERGRRRQG
jgi:carboxymethylenebutenolidase